MQILGVFAFGFSARILAVFVIGFPLRKRYPAPSVRFKFPLETTARVKAGPSKQHVDPIVDQHFGMPGISSDMKR